MNLTNYSTHVKRTAIEKVLGPSGMSVPEVSREMGINKRTLYGWVQKSNNGSMAKKRKYTRRKISFQEKYKAVLEFRGLSEEESGKWLRENGFHADQMKLWEQEIEAALNKMDNYSSAESEKEIRELKKELNRKEKALAEVSALLVLKKKFNALMGIEDDSEK